MSITLTKEQTEIFRKRTRKMLALLYIISAIVFMIAVTFYNVIVFESVGTLIITAYIGGIIGAIFVLASMPQIKYYQEEQKDE